MESKTDKPVSKLIYYQELMTFFTSGKISKKLSLYFGFEEVCYHRLKLKVPTKEQMDDLKTRLHLIITVSFSEKKMEEKLNDYVKNPSKYRKDLGEEFEWVRTYQDAKPYLKHNIPNVDKYDYRMRQVLYEFDPILNNT